MRLKKLSKIALSLGAAAVIIGGVQTINAPTACAKPFINIDYGEHEGKMHVWWMVDKGSVKGQPPASPLSIRAILCDNYTDRECRDYKFQQKNGQWYFRWDGLTGKSSPISSGSDWKEVSGDRLANDVLYIALQD